MKDTTEYRGKEKGQVSRVDPGSPAEEHFKKLGWKSPADETKEAEIEASVEMLNPQAAGKTEPPPPEAAVLAVQNKIDPGPVSSGTSHANPQTGSGRKDHGKG